MDNIEQSPRLFSEIVKLPINPGQSPFDVARAHLASPRYDAAVVLRWGLVKCSARSVSLEVAVLSGARSLSRVSPAPQRAAMGWTQPDGIHVALVIPTGVGASIGGFLGDASPIARMLAAVADSVIVHPNVVNAADFYGG